MIQIMLPFRNIACRIRHLLLLCLIGTLLVVAPAWAEPGKSPVRIGLPHSMFHMQYLLVAEWRQYLEIKLQRPVQFVTHRKFSDTTVQLYGDKLDFVWITDYPDAQLKSSARLLAVPLYKGQPYYTSYLIVPTFDTRTTSLKQLKGAVFVFADPSPNGSYLALRYELLMAGQNPDQFFRKTFFTRSHREVIKAVALGLANAGEVDSVVWDALAKLRPDLAGQTRVISKSQAYGAPPLIANHFVSKEDYDDMQRVLVGMAQDPKGIDLLKRLNLDGFIPGDGRIYEHMVKMKQALDQQ